MKSCASASAGRLLDLGVGRVGPADADVLGDRAVEQAGVLEHHARCCGAARSSVTSRDVVAVDQDAARRRARAGAAAARASWSCRRRSGRPARRSCRPWPRRLTSNTPWSLFLKRKRDVLVAHVAGDAARAAGVRLLAHAVGGVEQVEEAAQRRRVLEDAHGEARQQVELADQQAGEADEGHDLADRDLACAAPARRRRRRWRPR